MAYVGPEVPEHIQVGDWVVFSGYTGTLLHIPGSGKFIVMHYDFIQCTITNFPAMDVPGLYIYNRQDKLYDPCPLPVAVGLIQAAYQDADWWNSYNYEKGQKDWDVKSRAPKDDEILKMRGG